MGRGRNGKWWREGRNEGEVVGDWMVWALTSNRPVDGWGKLLGDVAAVSAMLERLLHQTEAG